MHTIWFEYTSAHNFQLKTAQFFTKFLILTNLKIEIDLSTEYTLASSTARRHTSTKN